MAIYVYLLLSQKQQAFPFSVLIQLLEFYHNLVLLELGILDIFFSIELLTFDDVPNVEILVNHVSTLFSFKHSRIATVLHP